MSQEEEAQSRIPPDYEALSYTWDDANGDRSLTQEIRCGPEYGKIAITKNCEAALLRLRLEDDLRFLWIDALCIDQSNLRERGHQVHLMFRIYHTAFRVVVFLGNRSFESDRLFDYLSNPKANHGFPEGEAVQLAMELFKRNWFKRLWALQEIVVARAAIIICGSKTIKWQALFRFFIGSISDAARDGVPFFDSRIFVDPAAMMLCGGLQGPQPIDLLPQLFRASQTFKASEPLDNIYAVLGLVEQDATVGILPDYSKSVFGVLYELSVCFVERFRIIFPPGLWVLTDLQLGKPKSPHTWIHRWTERIVPSQPIYLAEDPVVDGHLLTIKGQRMLKGFFNLPEEPVPLLRVRLADDKTYEVRHGTVMVSDGSTKQGHDDGGFIAVKVSEGSGVILKTRAASEEHSLIAGFSNPRHSHNSFRNEDYNYSSQANWLQEPRYFTIF
ncbi:hypothetical protein BFW01_g199 [Lasiodiplodia theobromae]|uniref:Heterokaryon incompatibility domain-containing protein n=1 Tax=Lasiodiplodia theobromae TaxID=45133 RepID=A0A8H7IQC6_9PEZI|nr:hypothetical protein BFW01_g199 [Lasiodiplodia theobromae]